MSLLLPFLCLLVVGYGLFRRQAVFADFCDGVQEGLSVCLKIFPTLLMMLLAIGVFRASGAMDRIVFFLEPFCSFCGIPSQILPLAMIRPLSGGGALSVCQDIFQMYGADSFVGRVAAVLSASTETTFYTLGIYLPRQSLKGVGKLVFCALLCDVVTLFLAITVCRFFF